MLNNSEREILNSPDIWAYPMTKDSFSLKSHYAGFAMVQLPKLKEEFKKRNDIEFLNERLIKLSNDQEEFLTINDVNNNNMDVFDKFYNTMEVFFKDIRQRLNIE